jgi:hypothetical protein
MLMLVFKLGVLDAVAFTSFPNPCSSYFRLVLSNAGFHDLIILPEKFVVALACYRHLDKQDGCRVGYQTRTTGLYW